MRAARMVLAGRLSVARMASSVITRTVFRFLGAGRWLMLGKA
jgi:hypothetical protein